LKQNILNNIQDIKQNNNNNTYCSNCLKLLDNNKDVVKDIEGNEFCDKICRSYFLKENLKLLIEVISRN